MRTEDGPRTLFEDLTWHVGPGDRIGIVGVNGAGKTSLLKLLVGENKPDSGTVVVGQTVAPAYLSQHVTELPPKARVLEAVQDVARIARIGNQEISASTLAERFGFAANRQWTPVGDLSGGERRRLQLLRLLMAEPNVLVLDEPTNDLDIDTLTALEDLLDCFPGTVLVVSHDRYFVDRVCDKVVALLGDGTLAELPGGVEEYLARRAAGGAPLTTAAGAETRAVGLAVHQRPGGLGRRRPGGEEGGRPAGAPDAQAGRRREEAARAARRRRGRLREGRRAGRPAQGGARGEGAGRGGVAGRLRARRGLTGAGRRVLPHRAGSSLAVDREGGHVMIRSPDRHGGGGGAGPVTWGHRRRSSPRRQWSSPSPRRLPETRDLPAAPPPAGGRAGAGARAVVGPAGVPGPGPGARPPPSGGSWRSCRW